MSIRQYWFVLWELTKRELKRKYARSFLGILWSCVYPLMRMALVVVLFSTIFNKGIEKYPASTKIRERVCMIQNNYGGE